MKKGFLLSGLLALSIMGCSTPMINTNQDFTDLEKEYKSFSTKALSDAYVSRMFNRFLTASPNPTQVIRQLEFARYLKGKSDASYFDSLKSIIANDTSIYTKIIGSSGVSQKMTSESGTFGVFVQSISPLPGVPVATTATAITATSFTANWNSVANATGYKLYIDGTLVYTGTALSFEKTGLNSGSPYTYYVQATNSGGTSSDSNTINVTTALSTPGSLSTTTITDTGFTANWGAVTGATSYDVIVDTLSAVNIPGGTSYVVTGLSAENSHTWKVRANKNSLNSSYSSEQSLITLSMQRTVSTFAGSGVPGSLDGTGISAQFRNPMGVAVDNTTGNVYVADYNNYSIRKITPAGVVSTFSTGFNVPVGLTVDNTGNIYVADYLNNRIRKITPAGVVSTFAGIGSEGYSGDGGQATSAQFKHPFGAAVDPTTGNFYVADYGNNVIRKITPAGVVSTFAGSGVYGNLDGMGTSAKFRGITGLAVDSSGNVYAADSSNNLIRKITPAGLVSTLAGTSEGVPDSPGTIGTTDGTGTFAKFATPYGVAVDSTGNVYVADYLNHRIRKITSAGVVSTIAGTTDGFFDGPATSARFSYPNGVALDNSGNVYVADYNNSRIRKIQ